MATAAPPKKAASGGVTLEVAPDIAVPIQTPRLSTGLACLEFCNVFKNVMSNGRRRGLLASEGLDGVPAVSGGGHLLHLFYMAYSNHYSLELAPHDVHNALCYEFNKYVTANAEALRHLFVAHDGQETLSIDMEGRLFDDNRNWPLHVHRTVRDAMPKHLKDPGLADWFIPQYSNTPPLAQTVAGVTAMSTMKAYFSYKCCFSCGLPRVTLTGTPEDWRAVRASIERLRQYVLPADTDNCPADAMAQWCDALAPVLNQFVATAEGRGDPVWWNRICQYDGGGSGPSYYTGWATVFHPFGDKGQWLPGCTDAETTKPSYEQEPLAMWFKLDTEDVTSGVCCVPVDIDDDGDMYKAELFAGQVGAHLSADGDRCHPTLRFVSGWAIYLVDRVPEDMPQCAPRATLKGYMPLSAAHERARALLEQQVHSAAAYFRTLAHGLPSTRVRVGSGDDAVVCVVKTAFCTTDDTIQLHVLGSDRPVMVKGAVPVAVECPLPTTLLRVTSMAGLSYYAPPDAEPVFINVPQPAELLQNTGAQAAVALDVTSPLFALLAPLPVGKPEETWRHWMSRVVTNLRPGCPVRLQTLKNGTTGTVNNVCEQKGGVRITLSANGATSLTRMPVLLDFFFYGKAEDPDLWVLQEDLRRRSWLERARDVFSQVAPAGELSSSKADDRWARVPSYVEPYRGKTASSIVLEMQARVASGSHAVYFDLLAACDLQGHRVRANGCIIDVRRHNQTRSDNIVVLESATGETHRVNMNVPAGQTPTLELLDERDGVTWLSLPPLPA